MISATLRSPLRRLVAIALIFSVCCSANADDLHARYLANAGVMLQQGNTTVLFDPLFRNDYGQYERVPAELERALFAGEPPFEDVDAVFVSHHHGDHFDPAVMAAFLAARPAVHLYAPAQAVDAILARAGDEPIRNPVTRVLLAVGESPLHFEADGIRVDAVRIPHSGWPDRRRDVENIAWRVTLADSATVLHLGDADTHYTHFENHQEHWTERPADLALPPYWFFLSTSGRAVLDETLQPAHAIGVHVPASVADDPDERPEEFEGVDLFTAPGEERVFTIGGSE